MNHVFGLYSESILRYICHVFEIYVSVYSKIFTPNWVAICSIYRKFSQCLLKIDLQYTSAYIPGKSFGLKFIPNQSDSIRDFQSEWIRKKFWIQINPRSEWFKRNTQSESIRRIPTSDSLGLKYWFGFIRIQSLGLTRIETDWFLTELHQTRLKTFFGLTRMSSDWRWNRFRNKSDWFAMNFNPKLLPGIRT